MECTVAALAFSGDKSGLEWMALCHLSVNQLGMQEEEALANQRQLSGVKPGRNVKIAERD